MSHRQGVSEEVEFSPKFRRLTELVEMCTEKANRQGERFNIFSILGLQRDEARTHSRFLAELLSPKGRHGEDTKFLRTFIRDVLGISNDVSAHTKVTRELPTEDRRRVDIVIESPDLIVGIEVKIDAGDQRAQLRDYYTELSQRAGDRKTAVLVYLTLDGKPPSADSLRELEKENVRCLSFAEDVRQWIMGCAEMSEHKPQLSHALIQYKCLIENLTGAGTSMLSLIADNLVNCSDDFQTALTVEKALQKAKAAVKFRFWDELSDAMCEAIGKRPTVYGGKDLREISRNYFRGRGKRVGIKYLIGDINGEELCLYVHIYNAICYGLRIDGKSGSAVSRPDVKARLRQNFIAGNAKADKDADWIVCYYHNPSPSQEPFVLNFDSFNESVVDLLDEEKRQAIVASIVEHQVVLINEAKSALQRSGDYSRSGSA